MDNESDPHHLKDKELTLLHESGYQNFLCERYLLQQTCFMEDYLHTLYVGMALTRPLILTEQG